MDYYFLTALELILIPISNVLLKLAQVLQYIAPAVLEPAAQLLQTSI